MSLRVLAMRRVALLSPPDDKGTGDGKKSEEDVKLEAEAKKKQDDLDLKKKSEGGNGDDDSGDDEDESKTKKLTFTKAELQAELDKIAQKVRAEEKSKREKAEQQATEKAEKEAAEKKGEWEGLYTTEKATVTRLKTELEDAHSERDELASEIQALIDSEIEDWPQEVKDLDPGEDNLKVRRIWLEKSRPLAKRLAALGAPDTEGGAGGGGRKKSDDAKDTKSVVSGQMKSRTFRPGGKSN